MNSVTRKSPNLLARLSSKQILKRTSLFDASWYKQTYPDVEASGIDALDHYIRFGAAEGRDPSIVFDTAFYLSQFSELDPRAVNPLCHYILIGEKAGAWPNPLFDPHFAQSSLAIESPGTILERVLDAPHMGIETSLGFNTALYAEQNPHVAVAPVSPLWHALEKRRNASIDSLNSPPKDLAVSDIQISAVNDLRPVVKKSNITYFEISGSDPFIELTPLEGPHFKAGHYQIAFSSDSPIETFQNPRLYFSHQSGYSELNVEELNIKELHKNRRVADFLLPRPARTIRFDPSDSKGAGDIVIGLGSIELVDISRSTFYFNALKDISPNAVAGAKNVSSIIADTITGGTQKGAIGLREKRKKKVRSNAVPQTAQYNYQQWIKQFDTINENDVELMKAGVGRFKLKPKISIVMPVYNTPSELLRECVESVRSQIYPFWELCIADDLSTAPHVREILTEFASADPRIKVRFRTENGHISEASNSALELATGEWVALMDHDDLLPIHALYCVVDQINKTPDAKLIYSDEDKIDTEGHRKDPYFKPDWNERLFFEQNVISHLGVYKKEIIDELGGFRIGFEGAQDHDLALRFTERIGPEQIVHIPHILYHWRVMPGSTALGAGEKTYALTAGKKALDSAIERRGLRASINVFEKEGYYRLRRALPASVPLVSIIIPTRDGVEILKPCVDSILEKTSYPNYEIIIVDNQSEKPETLDYFKELHARNSVKVINYDHPFNYSAINNFAVKQSKGEYICLLNNDTEVISTNWLSEMVAELSPDDVGAVGAKLLYTDSTLQHGGVVLGVGGELGVAGHSYLGIEQDEGGYFANALLCREVSAVTAACLLTKRTIFDDVRGLNEQDLKVAFNDIDFCLKVRRSGKKIIWTPYALLHHHESKSRGFEDTPEKQARFQKEVLYMIDTWGELLQRDPYYNPNLSLTSTLYTPSDLPRLQKPWQSEQ